MPTKILKDASVLFNSIDLSDHVRSVTLNTEFEIVEDTAMGTNWRSKLVGLGEFSIDLEFNQDYDAGSVDDVLWAALGQKVPVVVKPTSAAVGPTNPSYTGTLCISQHTPITGGVGELATVSVSWEGSGELVRATA